MNITHAVSEEVTGDKLKAIFDRQKELWDKYHHIEVRSGLRITEDCPVNLDDRKGQFQIKDYLWRIVEELGEALDAQAIGDKAHFQEELMDGLHFLVEMTLLVDRNYDNILPDWTHEKDYLEDLVERARRTIGRGSGIDFWVTKFIMSIGMLGNCLKNKPWKQSMMKTNLEAFYSRLAMVWTGYITILVAAGMDAQSIVDIYLRKSQVNKFRQRSNY